MSDSALPVDEGGRITIIITSSPVPSNPSTKMLSQVLASLSHSPYFSSCPIVLVFDGFTLRTNPKFKSAKISEDQSVAYGAFQDSVHQLLASPAQTPPSTSQYKERVGPGTFSTVTRTVFSPKVQTLSQSVRVGFALAVHSALAQVRTDYVLILQHDWCFTGPVPVESFLRTLDQDAGMNYIGFISRRTIDYANCKSNRAPSAATAEVVVRDGEPYTRLFFWYDKPHIGRTSYYKTRVFGQKRFKRGDFIEDTFGHKVLADCRNDGIEGWKQYGCWLWYPEAGQTVALSHLNGRKWHDEPGYWTTSETGVPYYKLL